MSNMTDEEREAFRQKASQLREAYEDYRRRYQAEVEVFMRPLVARNRK